MERTVLCILMVTVLMNISWAQKPRQLIRFGKRPFSSDRYRNQLAYLKYPQDAYKTTRTGFDENAEAAQQTLDFHHPNQVNDLRIRKWAEEDIQDLMEH